MSCQFLNKFVSFSPDELAHHLGEAIEDEEEEELSWLEQFTAYV